MRRASSSGVAVDLLRLLKRPHRIADLGEHSCLAADAAIAPCGCERRLEIGRDVEDG